MKNLFINVLFKYLLNPSVKYNNNQQYQYAKFYKMYLFNNLKTFLDNQKLEKFITTTNKKNSLKSLIYRQLQLYKISKSKLKL